MPIDLLAQSAVLLVQCRYFFNSPEWFGAEPLQPPRQAAPDTPPKEGNGLPECVASATNKIVRHPIYGNQNQVAQAVLFVQNGTLGRADILNSDLFNIR